MNNENFAVIIAQYHKLLERYAQRFMVHKRLAYSVAQEVFEQLYEQGQLTSGPHLREQLKITARKTWQSIDASMARAEAVFNDPPTDKLLRDI